MRREVLTRYWLASDYSIVSVHCVLFEKMYEIHTELRLYGAKRNGTR